MKNKDIKKTVSVLFLISLAILAAFGQCFANTAPVLDPIGAKSVNEGDELTFNVNGYDADGNTLTYSADALPSGAELNANNFSWVPDYNQAGSYDMNFYVSDGEANDFETVTIIVGNTNRMPILDSISNKDTNEGQLLTFDINAVDADGNSLTYYTSSLPVGAVFTEHTFTWTSPQIGRYTVTFYVTDGELTDYRGVVITVEGPTGSKYVSTSGSNSNSGNSWLSAYRTIQKALDNVGTGGTIYIAAGTYDYETLNSLRLTTTQNGKTIDVCGVDANTTILSSSSVNAITATTISTGKIKFHNMTFISTNTGIKNLLDWNTTDGAEITFDNCELGVPNDATPGTQRAIYAGWVTPSPPTRKLTLTNSFCYSKDNTSVLYLRDIGTLTIDNTILDGNNVAMTDQPVINLGYEIGEVNITNSTIIGNSTGLLATKGNSSLFTFAKCNIDKTIFDTLGNAIWIADCLQSGTFTNIKSNSGIYLGQLSSAATDPLGSCVIQDCNFVYSGNNSAIGIMIGYGCDRATVENCRIIGFGIGLNGKTVGSNFIGNVFSGGWQTGGDWSAVYLRATKDCNFINNTCYATGKYALWAKSGAVDETDANTNNNRFINNIFDASGGGLYALVIPKGCDVNGNVFNYNCYKAGSSGLAVIHQVAKTFDTLKTWWAANGGTDASKLNEANSINADPCFVDAANGDFRLNSGSLCLDFAQPIVGQENLVTHYTCDDNNTNSTILDTGRQNIGAWNPDGTSVRDTCDMSATGIIGGALSFDGNDYVDCDNTYKSNSLTLSVWVKPNDGQPSDSQVIFSKRVDDGNYFEIYLNTSGLFDANCVVQGVSKTVTLYQNAQSVSALADGDSNWIMLTAVMPDYNMSGTGNLLIGSSFWGSLDDLRIQNRELSADEVEALYEEVYPIKPAGDFDGDYDVDIVDLAMIVNHWLESCTTPDWCEGCDINESGLVDFADFALFADTWLKCTLANPANCWH